LRRQTVKNMLSPQVSRRSLDSRSRVFDASQNGNANPITILDGDFRADPFAR
jgi:hypothetical protein